MCVCINVSVFVLGAGSTEVLKWRGGEVDCEELGGGGGGGARTEL